MSLPKTNYSNESKKEVKKVVTGEVSVRKKPLGRAIADIFFAEDFTTVKKYVVYDIVVPGVKRLIVDAIRMMLLGEAGSGSGKGGFVDYAGRSNRNSKSSIPDPIDRNTNRVDYRDITFRSRGDAEDVLRELRSLIDEYHQASIADYFDLLGQTSEYTDNKYGWFDLSHATIRPRTGGYFIELPKPIVLDR